MKTSAEKSLDLIISIEKLNQEYKSLSDLIGKHTSDCFSEKIKIPATLKNWPEPCLTDWLERKFDTDYNYCPVTGREYEVKTPYWDAPSKTEKDCPHCFSALKLIEQRKLIKRKRGCLKGQLTKIAKSEILKLRKDP